MENEKKLETIMMALNVRYTATVLVIVLIFVADCLGKTRTAEDHLKTQMTLRTSSESHFGAALIFGGIHAILDRIGLGFLLYPILGIWNFFAKIFNY